MVGITNSGREHKVQIIVLGKIKKKSGKFVIHYFFSFPLISVVIGILQCWPLHVFYTAVFNAASTALTPFMIYQCSVYLEVQKMDVAILKFRFFSITVTMKSLFSLFTTILSAYLQITLSDILFRAIADL